MQGNQDSRLHAEPTKRPALA